VLALELAFIRQIPAEVRSISYFTNLVFMASFFGLGVGCLLERGPQLAWLLPVGLSAVAGFVYFTEQRPTAAMEEGAIAKNQAETGRRSE